MRCPVLSLGALALGVGLLVWGTDGLRAFTAEGARRLDVERRPREIPEAMLEGSDGGRFAVRSFRGQTILVDFIYTRCPTLCRTLSSTFARLQEGLTGRDDVRLLSISFDPADNRFSLGEHARIYRADRRLWRVARVEDPAALAPLLKVFGVIVIPDGLGGFEHNAGIHRVAPDGRLIRIYDPGDVAGVLADLR